ncbi:carboxymuconolactone decarboxylase family protein [Nonomuraea angiospora]|uniref:carboxymuconolactone decarboxylase family protein n=1 Tax=Nonomuraea angiospora TaxID=46172 RepID=UPI0034094A3F
MVAASWRDSRNHASWTTSSANADVTTAIQHLCKAMHSGGVDPLLLELVHLRASQINGCSPCVFAGVASATKQGRVRRAAAQRGDLVREALLHRGRAGCARADRGRPRIQDGAPGVTDEIWDAATAHFDEEQPSSVIH